FAAMVNFLKAPHRRRRATIVASEIDQRLFALENRSGARLFSIRPIRRHIYAVPTSRQGDFHRAGGVTLPLRPNESHAFQARVRLRFAATNRYALIHSASSRAQ